MRTPAPDTLAGRLVRLPLRAIPADACVRVLAGPLRGATWIRGAATHKCWLGAYEHKKAKTFAEHVSSADVVFDIGANVGFYTLLAARRVGPRGEVTAFEPLPRNIDFLRQHVELNNLENVTVVQAAVAESEGTSRFSTQEGFLEGHLVDKGGMEVEMVSIDAFVNSRNARSPNVMKIDVEGAELQVLKGAYGVLASARPIIFLATHGDDVHRDCCSFLSDFGYSLTPLDGETIAHAREVLAVPAR